MEGRGKGVKEGKGGGEKKINFVMGKETSSLLSPGGEEDSAGRGDKNKGP